jgi:citrate synthase
MFEAILCAAIDHGFVGSGTPATRYVVSGSGNLAAGVAAGLLTIGGSTAVTGAVVSLLQEIGQHEPGSSRASNSAIDGVLRRRLERRERVPGFGHPVHRTGDPRTAALLDAAKDAGFHSDWLDIVVRIGERLEKLTGKRLIPNVDAVIGAVFLEMGFGPDEASAFTILALAPSAVAHALEELRTGRPMRMISPADVRFVPA